MRRVCSLAMDSRLDAALGIARLETLTEYGGEAKVLDDREKINRFREMY